MSNFLRNIAQEELSDFEFDEEEYIRKCFANTSNSNLNLSVPIDTKSNKFHDSHKRKPIVYTKQVIPPDDIRRTYAKAFESAWNGYEREKLQELFHGIGTTDMLTIVMYPNGNPHGPALRELHGPETITEYYNKYQESVPDSLFLIHGTKYVIKQNGCVSIVCNFSLTGSRLFLVDATGDPAMASRSQYDVHQVESEINSQLATVSNSPPVTDRKEMMPEPPAAAQREPSVDLDNYLDPYNAINESLVFKDSYTVKNKHDKYRRLNHSTMGEYIDARGRTGSGEGQECNANVTTNGTNGTNGCNGSSSSTGSSSTILVKTEPGDTNGHGKRALDLKHPPMKKKFAPNEILVSSAETKFGLGNLLHSSVKMDITGILRFNVDANKKVYKLELMCAFEDDKQQHN